MSKETSLKGLRFVGTDTSVDLEIEDGRIAKVNPSDDFSNTWVIPGLWDRHTHFTQWSYTLGRLDLIEARSAEEALDMLREHLDARRAKGTLNPDQYVVGMRFRHSLWADDAQPTLVSIDAVTGNQPVALSSADMHCGWVNSAAAEKLGVHVDESGLVGELEWFDAYCKLDKGPNAASELMGFLRNAELDAARKGVVGIRDYEMAENIDTWIDRFAQGLDGLRVQAGVYPERLRQAIDDGWHTGDELPGSHGLGHVGAMKMISDGSLNTRSAYCSTPYSGVTPKTFGTLSYTPEQIESYMRLATEHGFDIACHAIGDKANTIVLDCAERTHAHGSIEHAQMLKQSDIPRLAQLGLAASIQPQHAMDDRDVITRFWAIRPGFLTHSTHCTKPERNFLWVPTRRSRLSTHGWLFPPPCSVRKAPTGNRSSRNSALTSNTPSHRPPHRGARICGSETTPIWCCSTATQASSMNRNPCRPCPNT